MWARMWEGTVDDPAVALYQRTDAHPGVRMVLVLKLTPLPTRRASSCPILLWFWLLPCCKESWSLCCFPFQGKTSTVEADRETWGTHTLQALIAFTALTGYFNSSSSSQVVSTCAYYTVVLSCFFFFKTNINSQTVYVNIFAVLFLSAIVNKKYYLKLHVFEHWW